MSLGICIIGIYFGKLPNYFELWLKSAENNPEIDFLIFTDCEWKELPQNIRFVQSSLADIKKRAERVLGQEVELSKPYKCCDYRPCFGLMFSEYLKEYAYWGHCDFDMIFGNISSFFNKYAYSNYDKFLSQGHLAIYRNTVENNKRFMLHGSKCGEISEVFHSPEAFAFDETSGIGSIFEENGFDYFKERIFADITPIHKRFTLTGDGQNYKNQLFYWENGKVFREYKTDNMYQKEEFLYIHFQKRGSLPIHFELAECDSFYITSKGFYR